MGPTIWTQHTLWQTDRREVMSCVRVGGGQLYRDVRCLLRVVSRFLHKPAIRWQGLSRRIRTSVQGGSPTQVNTKFCIFRVLLTWTCAKELWNYAVQARMLVLFLLPVVSDVLFLSLSLVRTSTAGWCVVVKPADSPLWLQYWDWDCG